MTSTDKVIWARLDRPSRGPQPSFSRERITRAAIAIADEKGLGGLTMRELARRIDAGTMSLYRYLTGKDDLLELMFDEILVEEPVPAEPSGDWRADLAELARGQRRIGHRHPWSVTHVLGRPSFGPNALRRTEYSLACLGGLGLGIGAMLEMLETVRAFTLGFGQDELAEREAQRTSGLTEEEWRQRVGPYLMEVLETGRYPYLTRVMVEADHTGDVDARFDRSLRRVLDGLATNLPPG